MEKIGINDKTDFYDNARSARNEKAQRRVGSVGKDDIDASGWAEPTMETERKTGGRPVPRAYKRGGKVDGQEGKKHAGRKPRASGGKLLKYIGAASRDAALNARMQGNAGPNTEMGKQFGKEGMKRSKGIDAALNKLEGKAKVPARADGGYINLGGKRVKDTPEEILAHVKKTFPNVKKVNERGEPDFNAKASGGKIHAKDCSCKMCSGGRAERASGGKLLKYLAESTKDLPKVRKMADYKSINNETVSDRLENAANKKHWDRKVENRSKGINTALDKLEGKAKVPARASGGKVHSKGCTCKMCSGGMAKADGGEVNDKPKRTIAPETRYESKYDAGAVDKAIKNNRTGKIGGREAKLIHSILKGRYASGGSANYTGGTRPDGGRIAKASGGKLLKYIGEASKDKNKHRNAIAKVIESGTLNNRNNNPAKFDSDMKKIISKNHKLENRTAGTSLALEKLSGKAKVNATKEPFKKGGKVKGKTNIHININTAPKPEPMVIPPPAGAMPPPAMMPKPAMPPMAGGLPPGLGVPPPAMGAGPLPRKSGGRVGRANGGMNLLYDYDPNKSFSENFYDKTLTGKAMSAVGNGIKKAYDAVIGPDKEDGSDEEAGSAMKSGGRASYKDMTAGAGGGKGRLEKTEIQKRN